MVRQFRFLVIVLIVSSSATRVYARQGLPRSSHNSIPRSSHHDRRRSFELPPWNPSSLIDDNGFLVGLFHRQVGEWESETVLRTAHSTDVPCHIRQVPGDGNCLFHSLSLCLQYSLNGTHWDLSSRLDELYEHSRKLRTRAVAFLRQKHRRLFLQGQETLRAYDLVTAAAEQYGLSADEYCDAMEEDCVWGGGPEIVALSNAFGRPIHVYELAVDESGENFVLRRMACFGSPRFDHRQPLHILSADSRFPDLVPGQQLSAGNHFLAVFPDIKRQRRRRIRGGARLGRMTSWLAQEEEDVEHESDAYDDDIEEVVVVTRLLSWWRDLLARLCM